jgi:hypothetical protein
VELSSAMFIACLSCWIWISRTLSYVLFLLAHLSSIKDLAINTMGSVEEGGGRIVWKS